MARNSKLPIESKPQLPADVADSVPDSLIGMFTARVKFEDAVLAKIKVAYDRKDSTSVYRLVGELLYSGPGTKEKKKGQK